MLFDRFKAELRPVPHVLDLVDRLQQSGTAFCIASSSTFNRIDIALDAMGVTNRFAHIFSAQQVARGKPAPDLFEYAARKMGVTPAACLVVEDSPHGVRAAGAAGMSAVGFLGGQHLIDLQAEHGAALLAAGAEFVLPSFEGLHEWT
jgi:HAD superfamily hydrolase (TIGR01509 family)